ncbi:mucin-5AC [Frankliniella occidentalis]|uniref:Mucin-5AC n=1 Tax=Frankliniella occidentalis TaxID=133901 RepID=A0A9C6WXN9_FRAOC|nr:mucin-5AC [Frankliniella occidentalis]
MSEYSDGLIEFISGSVMRWLGLMLLVTGAACAAGPQARWSAPAPDARQRSAEDLEAAESEWVPLAAPCPTCRAQGNNAPANTASLIDDDFGLTPPKAPVVQRQIFSARQPSFFPQDFPAASPSHSPFFPPAASPQPKQLFGSAAPSAQPQQQQPANHFLQQVGIPDNLQQFILSPPKQDFPLPNVQQVFVGPANLQPPKGYAKFELPYLSSLDTNRVERKVNKLPFFVAPLSFNPPAGYSKILLPPPHIGSVVVNSNVSSAQQQQLQQQLQQSPLPQLHEKDAPFTKTTATPPAFQSTVTFSLPSEITPVNPRLPTLVNSLDEGRPSPTAQQQSPTTPVTPVSHTTPRRQPYLRPTGPTTPLPPATAAPTARTTARRPPPPRPSPRTTEAAPVSTESYSPAVSVTPSPELASASPDQADPSFQSQRVGGGAGGVGPNGKRGRKRLRNQHRLNQQAPAEDAVRSSTEQQNMVSPTTERVTPARFSPENINLLQQTPSFPTERPTFGSSPFQTERPYSSTPFQKTDRPNFSTFQTEVQPNFSERPAFSTFPTERPSFGQSFSPSFGSSLAPTPPAFEATTPRNLDVQPASINGFLQQEQQPQPEEPVDINQIQFPGPNSGFQQEFFSTRLENGKVQYQYNLQPTPQSPQPAVQPQEPVVSQPDSQADFQPSFVRVRGRIQHQQQQQQLSLLPHVPVELQKAVKVNPRPALETPATTAFSQDAPSGPGNNLAVRVRGKIRSRPRQHFQQQQQQQQQQAEEEQVQPDAQPEQFLKETVIERTTTSTTPAPPSSVSYFQGGSVSAQTEAPITTVQQQQPQEQELAVTQQQQVSEEPITETTQPSTSTTRAGVRKYSSFTRTGAPRRPGLRVAGQTTAAPVSTTTAATTQRPRGTRRPPQLVNGAAVRGRVRARPTSTTEATGPDSADAPVTPDLYGRRRGPHAPTRTPPSAQANEVLDSDHQESVSPPRSAVQRFESRRRHPEDAQAAVTAPSEQPAEEQPAPHPVRVRVRRPGHRRQTTPAPVTGSDQSHADSKLAFALDNGEIGKDSQYGEKQGAAVARPLEESLPTVTALEAHPTFDWSAHSGTALQDGWSATHAGRGPLPPLQYSVSGAQGEVDAKPSEHSDDPSDYLEPTSGRPNRPASLDSISAQDVDNVMKALEEVGLLDGQTASPASPAADPSAPDQDILKEDTHKKAVDPTTQKKSGNGRRRGNWVRVRVKRPRDGLATAESQNAGSFPGNSVLTVVPPSAESKDAFEKGVSPSSPSAPSAADVELPAPTTTGVSFSEDVVTSLAEEEPEATVATTPRISSLSIAADAVDEKAPVPSEPSAEASAEPSAEPAPTNEPASAPQSTLIPATSSSASGSEDDADALRVSTTTSTPAGDLEEATTPVTTTTTPGVSRVKALLKAQQEQEQLSKFLGSTTSTKVSMETEICFRGRCVKTKGKEGKEQQQQDQVPAE